MKRFWALACLLACLWLAACGTAPPNAQPVAASPAISITDGAGQAVSLPALPKRIVSMAPSDTEILYAIGAGDAVVGVDNFSNYPAQAAGLPKIGGDNGSYNFEQIVALKPDLVLAAPITAPDAIKRLTDLHETVAVIGSLNTTWESTLADIRLVGQLTGHQQQAAQVTAGMQQTYEAVKAKVATAGSKPRVYWELDSKPFTAGPGNFVNDLIQLAGGTNVFGNASSAYPQVSLEQVVQANPEVIVLADAAYGVTPESVASRPGWNVIAAVANKRVYPIDPDIVSRAGPRLGQGLQSVAKLVHPELFS